MKSNFERIILKGTILGGLVLIGAAVSASAANLGGVVKYDGPKPKKVEIKMDVDAKCAQLHADKKVFVEEEVVGEKGGVKNAFVYLKQAPAGANAPVPAEPAALDQQGCVYTPRVQGMRVGQKLNLVNTDQTTHNIRCLAKTNKQFNFGQPGPGTRERVMTKPELAVKFKCDIHPWMTAYIFVMDHPFFAVTGEDGSFAIKNVPPGEYTLIAWHEKYGSQELKVKVDGDKADANFTYKVTGQ